MLKMLSFVSLLFILLTSNGGVKKFPSLTGETLDRKSVEIPSDAHGRKTLVGLAYSQKAQEAILTWYEPVFDKFVAKLGMFDSQYDVQVYFVPMFIGLKQSLYESTLKDLRAENRKDLYPYIVFYRGELEPYGQELSMNDKSLPYIFLLDEEGQIIYQTSGHFTERKMEEIESILDK